MPVDWRAQYGPSLGNTLGANRLYDVYTKRSFNRFANEAKFWVDDPDGDFDSTFEFGTHVQLDVKTTATNQFNRNFAGYVAGNPTRDSQRTVVEMLSFDAFLRRRTLNRGYVDTNVSAILEDLITNLTPVQWAGGAHVDVANDRQITRTYRGAKLDKVIQELSRISNTSRWGANFDNEFVFRPAEQQIAPVEFQEGRYYDANLSEDGKKAVFKVTVWYDEVDPDGSNDNRRKVEVDQLAAQEDLADKLNVSDPIVIEISKYYPQIHNRDAANAKANDIIERLDPLLVVELDTWEAFEVDPGNVARFSYPDRDIADTFRVAQIEHRWLEDKTTVKMAQNDTGVLDTLVQISDEIARLDARGKDENAVADRTPSFDEVMELSHDLKITKNEYDTGSYEPPQGNNVNISLDSAYSAPSNTAVDATFNLQGTQTSSTVIVDK